MSTRQRRKKAWSMVSLLGFLSLFLQAVPVSAADATVPFQPTPISTSLPGVGGSDPVGMIGNLYTFALAFSALLAFGAIVYGGIEYTVAGGNTSTQSEGRDRIKQALYGLLLLVGAYIILKTINPGLLELKLPTLSPAPTEHGAGRTF